MIRNILFDLGGVVIDLAFMQMVEAFEDLGVKDFKQYFTLQKQQQLFLDLELGNISPENFYDEFRKLTNTQLSNEQIRNAWNKILTPFIPERMALLEKLADKYKVYLFSNTNKIHADYFEEDCRKITGKDLHSYFTHAFYSQDLQLRKPEPESFLEVLKQAGIEANETLFIDDNLDNINGAQSVGIQTIHLQAPMTILDLDF